MDGVVRRASCGIAHVCLAFPLPGLAVARNKQPRRRPPPPPSPYAPHTHMHKAQSGDGSLFRLSFPFLLRGNRQGTWARLKAERLSMMDRPSTCDERQAMSEGLDLALGGARSISDSRPARLQAKSFRGTPPPLLLLPVSGFRLICQLPSKGGFVLAMWRALCQVRYSKMLFSSVSPPGASSIPLRLSRTLCLRLVPCAWKSRGRDLPTVPFRRGRGRGLARHGAGRGPFSSRTLPSVNDGGSHRGGRLRSNRPRTLDESAPLRLCCDALLSPEQISRTMTIKAQSPSPNKSPPSSRHPSRPRSIHTESGPRSRSNTNSQAQRPSAWRCPLTNAPSAEPATAPGPPAQRPNAGARCRRAASRWSISYVLTHLDVVMMTATTLLGSLLQIHHTQPQREAAAARLNDVQFFLHEYAIQISSLPFQFYNCLRPPTVSKPPCLRIVPRCMNSLPPPPPPPVPPGPPW
ncbi:hypothetical protein G7046_g8769 [Stylonectria norvegica]|nr:hypothetical protein G7046_g8769 [Stylonectria norvegica]